MLCPTCGEENPQGYRFCGMCGRILQAEPVAAAVSSEERKASTPADFAGAEERSPQSQPVPRILESRPQPEETARASAGPSLLGLDGPAAAQASDDTGYEPFRRAQAALEPDDHVTRRRRILALLALLLALGAAARWTYWGYVRAGNSSTHTAASHQPDQAASPATTPPQTAAAAPASPQPQASAHSAQPASAPPSDTHTAPVKPAGGPASGKAIAKAALPDVPAMRVTAKRQKDTAAADSSADTSVVSANMPAPDGSADADYRKGEAYLYGHGGSEDCEQAVKFMKSASAKRSAKARSAFGTMYATGHCVPRDLPTSYGWFALALQVDPNNQILEKDLTAIWNQMTPPERQLATKLKP